MLRIGTRWVGPFRIKQLLNSHALMSKWRSSPTAKSRPLYVGGITGRSQRFRTRVGDLLADAFGFYNERNRVGHHWGGRHLHEWCIENRVNPLNLYVAWIKRTKCHRCLEIELHALLEPTLNVNKPSHCKNHSKTWLRTKSS
jgi:hypothetical protein